jgi:hypothetical protein
MSWVAAPLRLRLARGHTNQPRATGSMVMGVMWPRKKSPDPSGRGRKGLNKIYARFKPPPCRIR